MGMFENVQPVQNVSTSNFPHHQCDVSGIDPMIIPHPRIQCSGPCKRIHTQNQESTLDSYPEPGIPETSSPDPWIFSFFIHVRKEPQGDPRSIRSEFNFSPTEFLPSFVSIKESRCFTRNQDCDVVIQSTVHGASSSTIPPIPNDDHRLTRPPYIVFGCCLIGDPPRWSVYLSKVRRFSDTCTSPDLFHSM